MSAFLAQLSHDASKWIGSMQPHSNAPNNDQAKEDQEQLNSCKTDSEIMKELMNNIKDEKLFGNLFNPHFHHASKLFNKLAHKMDISYHKQSSLNPIDFTHESNKDIMTNLQYAMRCAFLAYPPFMTAMKSQTLSLSFKTSSQALKSCLNISDKDIIIDNCSFDIAKLNLWNKTHQPSFYLIVDHNVQKIVLSIRGTASIPDIMTDLNANPKVITQSNNKWFNNVQIEGKDGFFVHEGMLESAEWVRDKVHSKLLATCNKYKDYQVIICGHSMGSGVASLLGLMYKDHPIIHKQNDLRVFSFAPPCVVSKGITHNDIGNDYITSVILGLDVVTRLSLESVRRWNLRQQLIMNYNQDAIRRCLLESESEVKENTMDFNESPNGEFLRVLTDLKSSKDEQELYPLGKILWFVPNVVMNEDVDFRKRKLMNLKDYDYEEKVNNDQRQKRSRESGSFSMTDLWSSIGVRMENNSSMSNSWREFCHDVSRSFNDIKTDIRYKLDSTKRNKKYDGSNYTLIDATKHRHIFQDLIIDIECVSVHEPQAYLWALNTKLRNCLYDEQDCF